MTKSAGCLFIVLTGLACGGTTDSADGSAGSGGDVGTSSAGRGSGGSAAGSAGKATGGSASGGAASGGTASGGTSSGGSSSGGSSSGGSSLGGHGGTGGFGGTGGTVGGSGGTGGVLTVDQRCPARVPMGTCSSDDEGANCRYDYSGCLCYTNSTSVSYLCQRVEPTCPNSGLGGAAGAAGMASAGTGGISTKAAVAPSETCKCTQGNWQCTFGP